MDSIDSRISALEDNNLALLEITVNQESIEGKDLSNCDEALLHAALSSIECRLGYDIYEPSTESDVSELLKLSKESIKEKMVKVTKSIIAAIKNFLLGFGKSGLKLGTYIKKVAGSLDITERDAISGERLAEITGNNVAVTVIKNTRKYHDAIHGNMSALKGSAELLGNVSLEKKDGRLSGVKNKYPGAPDLQPNKFKETLGELERYSVSVMKSENFKLPKGVRPDELKLYYSALKSLKSNCLVASFKLVKLIKG